MHPFLQRVHSVFICKPGFVCMEFVNLDLISKIFLFALMILAKVLYLNLTFSLRGVIKNWMLWFLWISLLYVQSLLLIISDLRVFKYFSIFISKLHVYIFSQNWKTTDLTLTYKSTEHGSLKVVKLINREARGARLSKYKFSNH